MEIFFRVGINQARRRTISNNCFRRQTMRQAFNDALHHRLAADRILAIHISGQFRR